MTFQSSVTQEQINALEKALASGTLEVTFDSSGSRKTVKYQSTDAMLKALQYMRDAMAQSSGTAVPQVSSFAVFQRD